MSVPVNERSHGKLEAYTKAYELAVYTLRITKNKKIFTVEFKQGQFIPVIKTDGRIL